MLRPSNRPVSLVIVMVLAFLALSPFTLVSQAKPGYVEEQVDLDALVKAAKAEGELVVYWTSSRITVAAKNFEAKYGIKVKGTKMADPEQAERVIREVDSGKAQVDAIGFEDGPFLETKLLTDGYVTSWFPKDLAANIAKDDQYPLVYQWQPRVFAYNAESYPKGCPVKNLWELTEPRWKGKVIIRDPALTPANLAFFATMVSNPEPLAKAYKDLYGKELKTKEKNAGWEFLRKLFENGLMTMNADGDIGDAVGAAGQKEAPIGMITMTKMRDNQAKNLKLATCQGLQPYMGYALPTYALAVKNAPHPNAAKLFIRYVCTPEGIAPWTVDDMGGFSSNSAAFVNPANEGSWQTWLPKLQRLDNKNAMKLRQEILDFWLLYGKAN